VTAAGGAILPGVGGPMLKTYFPMLPQMIGWK
jgi:hypothetical protein